MEEKILTNENELQEIEAAEDYEVECSGGGAGKIVALVLGLGGLITAGVVVGKKKIKPWLNERKAESLRKDGYVVCKADECEVRELEEYETFPEESEE